MCRSESPLTDVLPSCEPGSASYGRNGTQAVPYGGGVLLAIQPTALVSNVAGICSRPNWGMRIVFLLICFTQQDDKLAFIVHAAVGMGLAPSLRC